MVNISLKCYSVPPEMCTFAIVFTKRQKRLNRNYFIHTLSNGLRVALLPAHSRVAYCGFAIHSGSRNDPAEYPGLAHFVEHLLFKGTEKRRAFHINKRMELVGGELNAYTTKEDTFIYTSAPRRELVRSIELLGDLVRYSTYPAHELEKERVVVADEINLYKDTPSEQIFDDFEELLLGDFPLGHPILGTSESLSRMTSETCLDYAHSAFRPEQMVFFCMGQVSEERFVMLTEKYLGAPFGSAEDHRTPNHPPIPRKRIGIHRIPKGTHQSHTLIGGMCSSLHDEGRIPVAFLMNMLAGAGMNTRLNLLLRERHGWVYGVEGSSSTLSDTGWWEIYFGSDPDHAEPALQVTLQELQRMTETPITQTALRAWIKQVKGQLAMATENSEGTFLSFGRQILHRGNFEPLDVVYGQIEQLTAERLRQTAAEIFHPDCIAGLVYEGKSNH